MIWVVFALLTGACIFAVLWPLSRRPVSVDARELDVDFYRAQTAEIERDVTRGVIGDLEAELARTEAARRLMTASNRTIQAPRTSTWAIRGVAIGTITLVPAVALGLYSQIGAPTLPDLPLQARLDAPAANMDMATAIARIEQHLAKSPDDGRGWAVIAPIYLRLGKFDDAIRAYTNQIRIAGGSADLWSGLGIAQVSAGGGMVTADARKSFEKALALDDKSPRSLFYLGLASEQDGDKVKAVERWRKLLAVSPPNAPWLQTVQSHIASATGQAEGGASEAGGPSSSKAAAVAAMPADQQKAMIHRMVDGLADRLKSNGNDIDGWLKLVRAYRVLNEQDKAKGALSDARRTFAADAAAKKRLDDLAHELGLEG